MWRGCTVARKGIKDEVLATYETEDDVVATIGIEDDVAQHSTVATKGIGDAVVL